jgi:hypothetical protein
LKLRGYGQPIGDSIVLDAVIKASYAAAWQEATSPVPLSVVGSAATAVKRETIDGAVEVEYQANSGSWTDEELLQPFLTYAVGCPAVLVV